MHIFIVTATAAHPRNLHLLRKVNDIKALVITVINKALWVCHKGGYSKLTITASGNVNVAVAKQNLI